MNLKFLSQDCSFRTNFDVPDKIFNQDFNLPLVHQLIVSYQANGRSGNRAQKDRGDVKHSTRKPWKQKGLGRARAGMSSSPLWRGGGRIFPNSPDENFSQKINRKMYRSGMRSILSQLCREERVFVIHDDFDLEQPKTCLAALKMRQLGIDSALIITNIISDNLYYGMRNLFKFRVINISNISPVLLVQFSKTLIAQSVIAQFEEIFG